MDELLEEFIAETRDTLEALSTQLVEWERTPLDRELLDSVFRFVHTVKGSCGFLDLPRLLRISHAAEDVLGAARDGLVNASPSLVTAILAAIDRIAALTDALESGQAVFDDDEYLIGEMHAFLPTNTANVVATAAEKAILPVESDDIDQSSPRARARTVRVSLGLLDKLMNGVSDMVLARNEVSRQIRNGGSTNELENAFARLSTSVAEMRDAVGMMRMQHIDRLLSPLPRLVRDIAIELGKDIDLRIEGGEVEVDREMIEALRDPLTHILRNAADHGLETPEERRLAGKSPVGTIRIGARQSGNQILIEISDDGRGINLEKLGGRAIAANLVTAAEWQKMPEKSQLAMIFQPGISTADQISAISGRGVGMDVVRNNVQAVGGTIDLENVEGRGLKTTLRIPLTLSIIAGLSVRAGTQVFGITRNSVMEIISASNANVRFEELGGTPVVSIRGERYPYGKLETILGIDAAVLPGDTSRTLIVMRPAAGAMFVLEVAAVIDHEELVVKPGAPLLMETGLYAGTSLPDNGRPLLLLDANGLAQAVGATHVEERRNEVSTTQNAATQRHASALLFVDFGGRKRAIRLAAIERMEDIDVADIKYVGDALRAAIGDDLAEICELPDIPVSGQVKLLRLSGGSQSKYLAVADVLDICTIEGVPHPSNNPDRDEGIIHALGEPVELVNIFQYFENDVVLPSAASEGVLCFIASNQAGHWERGILAPLLQASGYRVSFEEADRKNADIVIDAEGHVDTSQDQRTVKLRGNLFPEDNITNSIYRYDRAALMAAIRSKIAGSAS